MDKIDSEKLTDLGSDYTYGENPMPGSGGTQFLCFQGVGSGSTILRLIYRQPWDLHVTPGPYNTPDFEITIEINE